MPTIMKATRKFKDPRLPFSNSAQVFAPAPPNSGAPVSPISALAGGKAYGNIGMFGSNTFEESGQQVMNMGIANPDRQCGPAIRSYSSPYGNPDLEYVYLGSPRTPSPFLNSGFSFVSNNPSNVLQPAPDNAFIDQHPLVPASTEMGYQNNFQAPLQPAQRFCDGVMESKAQVQSPLAAHGLYDSPTEPDLLYDDIWARLEADFLAHESAQQYDISPGDMGMVEAFGFELGASMRAPAASQAHLGVATSSCGSGGNSTLAEYNTLAMLSQALPDGVAGSSNGQAGFSPTSTGKTPTRRGGSQGLPQRSAHHPTDVAQNPNMYALGVAEFQGGTAMDPRLDMMDMVMEEGAVSDRLSSTENPSQREVTRTQIPYGYIPHSTPSNNVSRDSGGQKSSSPENNFRDTQPSQQMPEQQGGSYNASTGSSFNEPMTMTNDFRQLMSPGLLGIGRLGESCWAVQLLNLCASAIASQNISRTQHLMWVLNDLASAEGDVNQRFAAYGLKALFCRITDNKEAAATFARPRHKEQEISFGSDRVHRALVRFHDYVPWHQNCYTASSQTLLEVCAGKSRLHLIDIGASKGIEWPILIDALASRAGGPPSILRITMIRDLRREELKLGYAKSVNTEAADFMKRLVKFASVLSLHVEVNMVTKALECVTREDLRLRNGEILAVVCQFRLHRLMEEAADMPSPSLSPRDEFLDFLFTLNPHVFILSDNNSDHCSHEFLTRFHNASAYWWCLYEGLDIGYNGKDAEERQIIEFEAGTMMLNQVACEGIARIERNEPYHQWARRVRRAGFVAKDLSDGAKKACHTLVQNHSEFWDIAFDEANMVSLRWRKRPTTFTSVWTMPGSCSKPACKCSMLHS